MITKDILLKMIFVTMIFLCFLIWLTICKMTSIENNTKVIANQLQIDLVDVEILFLD